MNDVTKEDMRDLYRCVSRIDNAVARLEEQVKNMEKAIDDLVTRAEFTPVKLIAYGLAAGAMSAVVMAIISKVII